MKHWRRSVVWQWETPVGTVLQNPRPFLDFTSRSSNRFSCWRKIPFRGACMAESIKQLSIWLLVSAQVMISQFLGIKPHFSLALLAKSLLGIFSLPVSCPSLLCRRMHACSLPLSLNKLKKKKSLPDSGRGKESSLWNTPWDLPWQRPNLQRKKLPESYPYLGRGKKKM